MKKAVLVTSTFLVFTTLVALSRTARAQSAAEAGQGGDAELAQDISNTFVQPFAAYTWPSAWTVSLQSESSYNWKAEKWSIPINAGVAKLVRWGRLPVSLQAGVGYWAESPDTGPEGLRFRLQATFVLPKLF